jgi:leucyl-tRNA synthetase
VYDLLGEIVVDEEGTQLSLYDDSISTTVATERAKDLNRELHRVIGKVTADIERFNFNTAISAIMELVNTIASYLKIPVALRDAELARWAAETLVLLFAPMAPHMCEELWQGALGKTDGVHVQPWPTFDPAQAVAETVELAVQINGKVRARVVVARDTTEDEVREAALEAAAFEIDGRPVKKLVVVPGKLVNIVV